MDNLYDILKDLTNIRYRRLSKTYLKQEDFNNGTYTIDKPGVYILSENIIFKPNENKDFLPDPLPINCIADPFTLGFFAAIRICCEEVVLDLNGFKMEQSNEHYLQQRFFSLIELADRPFQSNTGPGNFGTKLNPAKMTTIRNGILGKSSHHSIHGNLCTDILIEDITFIDFEIAACSLNSFHRVVIKNCIAENNNQSVPVFGIYSASRFIRTFLNEAIKHAKNEDIANIGRELLLKLETRMNKVFKEFIDTGKTTDELYMNKSQLQDGNTFGFIFHGKFNVADFQQIRDYEFTDLVICDVTIKKIHNNVNEIIAIADENKKPFTDPAGSVFQIETATSNTKTYKKNELAEIQLYLAEYGDKNSLCRSNLHNAIGLLKWKNDPNAKITDIINKHNYQYICNGDSMHHLNKGNFGIKIDGGKNVLLQNIQVKDIKNHSRMGSDICGEYIKSHKDQSDRSIGYTGCNCRGISISASTNIELNNIIIDNINSMNGNSFGIDIFNTTEYCNMNYIHISNIQTGTQINKEWIGTSHSGKLAEYTINNPNKIPTGYGIRVDKTSCILDFENIKITGDNKGPINFIPITIGDNLKNLKKDFI
jgi:hypothetical protein